MGYWCSHYIFFQATQQSPILSDQGRTIPQMPASAWNLGCDAQLACIIRQGTTAEVQPTYQYFLRGGNEVPVSFGLELYGMEGANSADAGVGTWVKSRVRC